VDGQVAEYWNCVPTGQSVPDHGRDEREQRRDGDEREEAELHRGEHPEVHRREQRDERGAQPPRQHEQEERPATSVIQSLSNAARSPGYWASTSPNPTTNMSRLKTYSMASPLFQTSLRSLSAALTE